jgi:Domain of unknown function (DUF4407)
MANLSRTLTLKTYGSALAGGSVGTWIGIARLLMFVMGTVEFLVWGYAAWFIAPSPQLRWPLSIGVAFVILILVLSIDIMLLTSPMKVRLNEVKPAKNNGNFLQEETSQNAFMGLVYSGKIVGSIIARIGLAIASVVVMAPFLNLAVFDKDITATITQAQSKSLDLKEKELLAVVLGEVEAANVSLAPIQKELALVREQNRELRTKFAFEVDGTGGTKRPGRGPIAKEIDKKVAESGEKIDQLEKALLAEQKRTKPSVEKAEATLFEFLKARSLKQSVVLETKFAISENPNSLNSRLTVYREDISESESAKTVRWLIVGFQAFIIMALLMMKMFEPSDVGLYYDSTLQNALVEFSSGKFDEVASPGEKRSEVIFPLAPSLFLAIYTSVSQKYVQREKAQDQKTREQSKTDSEKVHLDHVKQRFEARRALLENLQRYGINAINRLHAANQKSQDLEVKAALKGKDVEVTQKRLKDPSLVKSEYDRCSALLEQKRWEWQAVIEDLERHRRTELAYAESELASIKRELSKVEEQAKEADDESNDDNR